jgi:hypothetical protein
MDAKTMGPLVTDPTIGPLVDTALKHLFAVQFRLGFGDSDDSIPWAKCVLQ